MAERFVHRSSTVNFEPVRQGLWLVIDIIDDLKEWDFEDDLIIQLGYCRDRVMDVLFLMRRIELDTIPGSSPVRLEPGWPAA